jgi:glutamate N-acetyltransferase/amino-acid N-acetyltransferase
MTELLEIDNSVTAPQGFRAAGVAAGLKPSGNPDVALIFSDLPATAAALFTTNKVVAAPILVCRENLADSTIRAIAVNAGCANACTGELGLKNARQTAAVVGKALGVGQSEVLVASTGVIGRHLPMAKLLPGLVEAAAKISADGGSAAARAIMTTDTRPKECAVEVQTEAGAFRIGGICKGSGMIAPNMATMLAFLTTDAAVPAPLLQSLLKEIADETFHCVTVDGDTSTNDMLAVLANGASPVDITEQNVGPFRDGLRHVCTHLAKELARDGEGATKLVEVRVTGARSEAEARQAARSIANSPLVKTALFGNDPNWGRILCAAGYSGIDFDPAATSLTLCGIPLVKGGEPLPFDEQSTGEAMKVPEVLIELDLAQGPAAGNFWTCDFSYDYVRINAEYTT